MKKVRLFPLQHRQKLQIGISFGYDRKLFSHSKQLNKLSWSQTHKCFYLEYSAANKQRLFNHFRAIGCFVDNSELNNVKPPQQKAVQVKTPPLSGEAKKFSRNTACVKSKFTFC